MSQPDPVEPRGTASPRPFVVLEVDYAELIDPKHVWRAGIPLEEYRRRRAERTAAQRAERDAIDWRGFMPQGADVQGLDAQGTDVQGSGTPDDEQRSAPSNGPASDWSAFAPKEPVAEPGVGGGAAQQGAPGQTPDAADAVEDREWHLELRRIVEAEVVERVREAMASGRRLPTASEYRDWSDARIAALRAESEAFTDEPAEGGIATAAPAEEVGLDLHPLNRVMERVQVAQRLLRQAEAARVEAAATAWKAALASVTGTPDAAVNGPFQRSIEMQLAYDLQVAEQTATALVHAAVELEARTPRCWAAFQAGDVPWRGMQMVHARLEGLDARFEAAFDERAAAAITTVALPRLKAELLRIRERVQAVTARERHAKAMAGMRVTVEPAPDGMAWLTALLPAAEAIAIDLRLDQAARAAAAVEGETRSIGQLRAHVLLDVVDEGLFRGPRPDVEDGLAVPQRREARCKVGLLIPAMTALGHAEAPAVLEGYGPIDIDTAKRLAGGASSWIKVLTDPVNGAVLDIGRDRYRPTADLRALLGILDGAGRGPNSARPPSQSQVDHVDPFRQGLGRGRTALDNLVLLAVRDHAIKTSGLWDIELRAGRDLAWTSFMGTRIITTVEGLEPNTVPERFRTARGGPPGQDPPGSSSETETETETEAGAATGAGAGWADPGARDELDCPF